MWTRRQSWAQFDTSLAQWEGVTMDMTCFGLNANQGLSKFMVHGSWFMVRGSY